MRKLPQVKKELGVTIVAEFNAMQKNKKIYPSGQFTCQAFKIKKCGSYEGPVWRKHAEELGIEGALGNSLRTL